MEINEYLWPSKIVTMFGENANSKSGLIWQQRYQGDPSQRWTGYYQIPEAIHIDMAAFNYLEHVSYATKLVRDVFTFNNGCTLKIGCWWNSDEDKLNYCSGLFYNNEEVTIAGFDDWSRGSGVLGARVLGSENAYFSDGGGDFYYPHDIVEQGLDVVSATNYFGSGAPPEEGVSAAEHYTWFLLGPARNSDNIALLNDRHVTDYDNKIDISLFPGTIVDEHCGISGGLGYLLDLNPSTAKLSVFETQMKAAGHGATSIFSDQPDPEEDDSGTGGGQGNYDPSSDPIDFPGLPTGGALECGFIKGYTMSTTSLQTLLSDLWNKSVFDISALFQKLVEEPMECIISLHALPCYPTTQGIETIKIGNYQTSASGTRITNEYIEVDCGTIDVKEYFGSALDYAPYTRCEIYLPFIGIKPLNISDVEKTTIKVKYYVDALTGDCVAFVKCGQSVLYNFTGNCKMAIPVSAKENSALSANIKGTASIVGSALATGGMAAPIAAGLSTAASVATTKESVSRSGDLSGTAGMLSEFKPYFIFHRPKQSLAKNFKRFKGHPTNITYTLSALTGYTEVDEIHLDNIPNATGDELNEIERLLKEGVIL